MLDRCMAEAPQDVQTHAPIGRKATSNRVIWHYDPIVFTGITSPAFQEENFRRLSLPQGAAVSTRNGVSPIFSVRWSAYLASRSRRRSTASPSNPTRRT